MYCYGRDLIPEVADYILSHPEELDINTRYIASYVLKSLDEHQSFGARELVVYGNFVPIEEMIKWHEKKLGTETTYEEVKRRVEEMVNHSLYEG